MTASDFEQADEFAESYDAAVQKHGWNSPQVLFDLTEDNLEPGERLLDLGIGTGLSAIPFHKAGLRVFGMDGSGKMLERCVSKGVTVELKQHDIRSAPLPYSDDSFDHAIACGVFHLVGCLDGVFAEVARVVRDGGTFAFTVENLQDDRLRDGGVDSGDMLEIVNEKSGVSSFLHSHDLIQDLLRGNGFTPIKTLDYVAYGKTDWADERSFRAYAACRNEVR
jgi:predicted TPR repeat methyltransferase